MFIVGMSDLMTKFGAPKTFVDGAFVPEANNALDANQNFVNKKRCMAVLFREYFIKSSIAKSFTIDGKIYHLRQEVFDGFQLLIQQRPPTPVLSKTMTKQKSKAS